MGCLVVVGFEPCEGNFISSIFLQFSDESHISSLDLIDQKLTAKKIRHDYRIAQYCDKSHQIVTFYYLPPTNKAWFKLDDVFLSSQSNAVVSNDW